MLVRLVRRRPVISSRIISRSRLVLVLADWEGGVVTNVTVDKGRLPFPAAVAPAASPLVLAGTAGPVSLPGTSSRI
jgi:hypothetical protein